MKLSKIKEILNARIITPENYEDIDFQNACGCDLMSDVLAFVKDHSLLLTGLINLQAIRTAEMMDIKAIVFVRGKNPGEDITRLALEKEIILLSTDYPLYKACGLLYSAGLNGKEA